MKPNTAPALSPGELTGAERAIWAGQKLCPDAPLYNMALLVSIDGDLSPDRFIRALESVIRRSDSLRTVFVETEGMPRRRVLESIGPVLEQLDFSSEADPDALLDNWCKARTKKPFALDAPLIDCALIRLGPGRHAWFINAHHLIVDAASEANLVSETGKAYLADRESTGIEAEPALPRYADFLASLSADPDAPELARARQYWQQLRQRLPDSASQPIAFYGQTPASPGTASTRITMRLSPQQISRLRELASNPTIRSLTPGMTLHNIFLTTLLALLHRLSGRAELVVGAPGSFRSTSKLRELIGLMVALYPLHLTFEEHETFASLLHKTRQQSGALLMNLHPGATAPEGLASFNVVLNYITAKVRFADFTTATRWIHPDAGDANHHLRLEIHDFDASGEPELLFDLNRDVFDEYASRRLLEHFRLTLDAFLAAPETPIAQIELSPEGVPAASVTRQESIPVDTAPRGNDLVAAFDEQVAASADKLALVTDHDRLTYRELAEAAQQLAHRLIHDNGVEAGDIVAIVAKRDASTIVSILATLMAGAAYLPIDPVFPDTRISQLLADARAKLVLGANEHSSRFAQFEPDFVGTDTGSTRSTDNRCVKREINPSDLAYVLYTSGTTGTPNGVLVEHRQVLELIRGLNRNVLPHDRPAMNIALVAPFVFDASVQQIFSALLLGHCLHVVPEDARLNGGLLRAFYARHRIDLSDGTPAHLKLLSDTGAQRDLPLPARFVLGGDRMTRAQLSGFYQAVHPATPEVVNIYGVAECTVDSASLLITADKVERLDENIPIGNPLPNAEILIVNQAGSLQPPEIAGQILIAGPGVARGYLDRPALTQARFVPHPVQPSKRAYLTGDRGYYDRHGTLHFLGRIDSQIKSRGIRIEPGEIEHHLMSFNEPGRTPVSKIASADWQTIKPLRCQRCLLTGTHPGVSFNEDGVCNVCERWAGFESASKAYFQTESDFIALHQRASRERDGGQYDCMLLYSGGKDSSYVLHRLVELGLNVLAFTFDNGFISNAAFENIRRQTERLGVDSLIERASTMDEIFVESLLSDSTVCSGCFRALTAISTRLAHEHNINMVVTGLSRGQIFDTKLAGLYEQGITGVDAVEQNLRLFRKVFHANDDRTAQLLDVDLAAIDIDRIHFVDFFRYDATGVAGVRAYLAARDNTWSQPQDTGFCSSNCVMNDVGICVHGSQKGFHNYEAPLSWDIRLGVSQRDDVLPEVTTPVNTGSSVNILQRIGFFRRSIQAARVLGQDPSDDASTMTDHLTAYFQANQTITADELRDFLGQRLPPYLVPSRFIQVARMPYTANGKVDDRALRQLDQPGNRHSGFQAPATPLESQLAEIWSQVLGVQPIGIHDNFFDLGGDSIAAIQIVGRANAIGFALDAPLLLKRQTIARLASTYIGRPRASQQPASGSVSLTPAMNWFLSATEPATVRSFAQFVAVQLPAWVAQADLTSALHAVIDHHDAFRLRFSPGPDRWQAAYCTGPAHRPTIQTIKPDGSGEPGDQQVLAQMAEQLDPGKPEMIQAAIVERADSRELLIIANHLVVDAVSWPILLQDLGSACRQISIGQQAVLPEKTFSFQAWSEALIRYADSGKLDKDIRFWRALDLSSGHARPIAPNADFADLQCHCAVHHCALLQPQTAELTRLSTLRKRPLPELLLLALAVAVYRLTGHERIRFDVEGHGRESFPDAPDVSRTVGWFTSLYPVLFSMTGIAMRPTDDILTQETIDRMTDQYRAIPANGFSFGLIHHLTDAIDIKPVDDAPILFNFLGQLRSTQTGENNEFPVRQLGLYRAPEMLRRHPLEIAASIDDGQLRLEWVYTTGAEQTLAVGKLANGMLTALQQIMQNLDETGARRSSAFDFPQARLDSGGMNKLAAALGKADARARNRGGAQ